MTYVVQAIRRLFLENDPFNNIAFFDRKMPETILDIKNVGCSKAPGEPIFSHVNFKVNEGDVLILQGKSGCG